MYRVLGILTIVLGIYFAAEMFLKTAEQAEQNMDQVAAELGSDSVGQGRTGPQAAGDRVRDAFAQGTAKLERAMPPD